MKTPAWQDNFKSHTLRVGFRIGLSRSMCEFLSAVADDVHWDRAWLGGASPDPDNFITVARALEKRGLIQRRPDLDEKFNNRKSVTRYDMYSWSFYLLTPAGKLIVDLLKLAGMFIEADIAVEKKERARR